MRAPSQCALCADVRRYEIEQAYLEGRPADTHGYTRRELEAHIAHSMDAETMSQIAAVAGASAIAARLRMLEAQATAILDAAAAKGSLGVALQALREARQTIETMAKLAGHLTETLTVEDNRPDLDARIAQVLDARGVPDSHTEQRASGQPEGPRALGPGTA